MPKCANSENQITGRSIADVIAQKIATDMAQRYSGYSLSHITKAYEILNRVCGQNNYINSEDYKTVEGLEL